jgi:hypothetical protein
MLTVFHIPKIHKEHFSHSENKQRSIFSSTKKTLQTTFSHAPKYKNFFQIPKKQAHYCWIKTFPESAFSTTKQFF